MLFRIRADIQAWHSDFKLLHAPAPAATAAAVSLKEQRPRVLRAAVLFELLPSRSNPTKVSWDLQQLLLSFDSRAALSRHVRSRC